VDAEGFLINNHNKCRPFHLLNFSDMLQAFFHRVAEADGKNNREDLKHKKILLSLQP
jgi:hypothetical protein